MAIYSKESLDTLKQRVDLIEVLSPHVELKRSGAAYKGLCPFHDEKSPSFMIQKGDRHYHCFGCGAHGDAIHFLMTHLKLSFSEAVENLAEKFHVPLEKKVGGEEYKGPNKKLLKDALEKAAHFFHFYLLHTPEGHEALQYLYQRSISLDFIRAFQIGLAPNTQGMMRKILSAQGISDEIMESAGLIARKSSGGFRDFFSDRITFPIHHATGGVIAFSSRKYKEETFGGKYINSQETPLFKKSRVLFGLNYCRKRIAKERKAIIVEGQIDALRLIHSGLNFTVAGQGTAFGEGHAQELINLGVNEVYLALDADEAGMEATTKIGNLFQKEGIEVKIVTLPPGSDPDSFVRNQGAEAFIQLMEHTTNYLDFLIQFHGRDINIHTPAGKNEIVGLLSKQIREWKHPLMVHESLRKLSNALQVPEHILGVGQDYVPNIHIRKSSSVGLQTIDPDKILESDFLRWLLVLGAQKPHMIDIARENIKPPDMRVPVCQRIYQEFLRRTQEQLPCDLLSLIDHEEDQDFFSEIMNKKVNHDKGEDHFTETIQKILDRNWMEKREEIKREIHSGKCTDEQVLLLLKQFDALKKEQPKVILQNSLAAGLS